MLWCPLTGAALQHGDFLEPTMELGALSVVPTLATQCPLGKPALPSVLPIRDVPAPAVGTPCSGTAPGGSPSAVVLLAARRPRQRGR